MMGKPVGCVLAVEDDVPIRRLLVSALTHAGLTVASARDGSRSMIIRTPDRSNQPNRMGHYLLPDRLHAEPGITAEDGDYRGDEMTRQYG